jgi:hypothetical protein
MRRNSGTTLLSRRAWLVGAIAASGCATVRTGSGTRRYGKVLVLTVGYRYELRTRLEDDLVRQLRSGTTDALASHIVLPPGLDTARSDLERAASGHQCDALLTLKVVEAAHTVDVQTGGVHVGASLADTSTWHTVWTERKRIEEGTPLPTAIRSLSETFASALRRDDLIV